MTIFEDSSSKLSSGIFASSTGIFRKIPESGNKTANFRNLQPESSGRFQNPVTKQETSGIFTPESSGRFQNPATKLETSGIFSRNLPEDSRIRLRVQRALESVESCKIWLLGYTDSLTFEFELQHRNSVAHALEFHLRPCAPARRLAMLPQSVLSQLLPCDLLLMRLQI